MSVQRKMAVQEGRAMVRVRKLDNGEPATVGLCPACWNIPERRRDLLIQLKKMRLEVAFKDDGLQGTYRTGKKHAPGCRFSGLHPDPWQRFKAALGR